MRKPALRWLASLALVASCLVIGAAPAPATHEPGQHSDAPYRGQALVASQILAADTIILTSAYVLQSGQSSCSNGMPFNQVDRAEWAFAPGSTINVCVAAYTDWDYAGGHDFPAETWTSVKLTIRDMNGSQLGGGYWETTSNPGCQFPPCYSYSPSIPFRFDTDPLNGVNDPVRTGAFELFVERTTTVTCTATCNSRGTGGPYQDAWAQGYVVGHGGLMAGEDPNVGGGNGLALDGATVGKAMPVVRLFSKYWNPPCSSSCQSGEADVDSYTAAGKLVMWSNKPHFTPASGHSAWYDIANGTKDSNLDSQITTLANMATAAGAPGQAVLIFGHEPWGNSTDKGCTGISNPTSSGCYGSSLEFRAAFTRVKARINALVATGTIAAGVVKLAYTEIDTKATKWGNDGISGGSSVVGGADVMYPGNPNRKCNLANNVACSSATVDLLAHDVYNYYQYKAGGSGPPNYVNGTWRPLKDKLFDTTQTGGGVGMGMIPLAKRLNKKLLIAELGSHPGCLSGDTAEGCGLSGRVLSKENGVSATRTEWFTNGIKAVEMNTDALQYLLGWSYFHQTATWDWRFISHGAQINPPVPDQTLDAFHQRGTGSTGSPGESGTGWKGKVVNSQLFKASPVTIP